MFNSTSRFSSKPRGYFSAPTGQSRGYFSAPTGQRSGYFSAPTGQSRGYFGGGTSRISTYQPSRLAGRYMFGR